MAKQKREIQTKNETQQNVSEALGGGGFARGVFLVVVDSVSRQTAAPRWQKSVTTILKLLTMIPVFGKSSL